MFGIKGAKDWAVNLRKKKNLNSEVLSFNLKEFHIA